MYICTFFNYIVKELNCAGYKNIDVDDTLTLSLQENEIEQIRKLFIEDCKSTLAKYTDRNISTIKSVELQ